MVRVFETEFAGRKLSIETGKYAEQANGSCIVRCDETAVMVNVTMAKQPREGIDFFPLNVEFEEKQYSVGKIPGGFIRREGRPSEKAILTSRLIDRPIRPLFPKGFYNDVQVVATAMSVDTNVPPDIYAMIGSSVALSISDIPFAGPTGSVTVGLIDGAFVINPDSEQREKSKLHLTVSGTKDAIMMVEAGANEVTEDEMLEAIMIAHEEIKKLVAFQEEIVAEIGKEKKQIEVYKVPDEVQAAVREYATEKIQWVMEEFDRHAREDRENQVEEDVQAHFAEIFPEMQREINDALYVIKKETMRRKILDHGVRPDGRGLFDIRPIWCDVHMFARPHGSAVFTRGQTQVITMTTLGPIGDAQELDGIDDTELKRYMHHYNMPPYSTGEAKPMRSPGRREIGHGALAERALEPMIPSVEEFPYAIRLVSEAVSSNGSTSMASVCGSTLSLMDAGVPIKAPVAGAAMGLIKDTESDKVAVLTDIQGLEDFLGDMDFKVAGTAKGITAIQMDIKIKGIDEPILKRALAQAHDARMFILNKMLAVLDKPRSELSKYAPKTIVFHINVDKIREVIGPGGKMINKIIDETGVKIDIEDDGRVVIYSSDQESGAKAKKMIDAIAKDIEVGEVYLGTVVRIMPFGAFVELLPGKDGMVHISKLAHERVEKVEDVVNIGDQIMVKVVEIDDKGRINLSRKDLLPNKKSEG
ncbi:MAG: polyribonucleotide nucleotidyltransferase [Clostridiales bacterium]|nr:polyribonucleotide nucleotidyltransferase [Clostridiales bacterium]